jgi:hypothetical protein
VLAPKEGSKGREIIKRAIAFLLLVRRVSPGDCQGFVAQAVFLSWHGRNKEGEEEGGGAASRRA